MDTDIMSNWVIFIETSGRLAVRHGVCGAVVSNPAYNVTDLQELTGIVHRHACEAR